MCDNRGIGVKHVPLLLTCELFIFSIYSRSYTRHSTLGAKNSDTFRYGVGEGEGGGGGGGEGFNQSSSQFGQVWQTALCCIIGDAIWEFVPVGNSLIPALCPGFPKPPGSLDEVITQVYTNFS